MLATQKSGWSPLPGGYQRLLAEFPANESLAVDKALWDWTLPSWVIYIYVVLKFYQMKDSAEVDSGLYWRLVWARLRHVLGPCTRFEMPNGLRWRQQFWGVMKSGCYLTLSLNSLAQEAQHVLAWLRCFGGESIPLLWAMGDDTLVRASLTDEEKQLYWDALESTGCLVKKMEYSREFCGFLFNSEDDVRPLYPDKHRFIMKFVRPETEQDTMYAFELLYALSKDRWVDCLRPHQQFVLGPAARLWARGLIKLKVLARDPDWVKLD
ncbi:hypothetical protein 2 [Wuhan house centipede virus 4]|uniref:hypothetical protein 2 n=1 Tax=Wuhan house centipede virus 4 TaxID=1923708 RepID=UPI00090A105C|nr:hypothetical protein 2 [Wuhan house centipede virus 4]APG75652.1 hypothetical protein [Wuhan house centipede virus 4]APG75946.1 hypothetical protein 2 [Wuhan house centipede virus 4]